jgi:hypothetical protein
MIGTALLAAAIWVAVFLLPRARRERDWFALLCTVLALIVALLGWLLVAAAVRSA